MTFFHQHLWTETSRRFNPPTDRAFKATSASINIESMIYGITVVELRCEKCGDIKSVRYVGTAS